MRKEYPKKQTRSFEIFLYQPSKENLELWEIQVDEYEEPIYGYEGTLPEIFEDFQNWLAGK